ncbi:ADP-ribosylation factor-like protein 2 [Serendipita sp. 405]|nr:ADP-ribosylation factor-like protein 2 [Serendipita sp. 405]
MGLLTVIRKNRRKERQMRILFLGLDNAGKTTIVKKLNNEDVSTVSPTLGFNIKTFVHGKYTLNICKPAALPIISQLSLSFGYSYRGCGWTTNLEAILEKLF